MSSLNWKAPTPKFTLMCSAGVEWLFNSQENSGGWSIAMPQSGIFCQVAQSLAHPLCVKWRVCCVVKTGLRAVRGHDLGVKSRGRELMQQ